MARWVTAPAGCAARKVGRREGRVKSGFSDVIRNYRPIIECNRQPGRWFSTADFPSRSSRASCVIRCLEPRDDPTIPASPNTLIGCKGTRADGDDHRCVFASQPRQRAHEISPSLCISLPQPQARYSDYFVPSKRYEITRVQMPITMFKRRRDGV